MSENFVKLDRKILKSDLFQHHSALVVFFYFLMSSQWRRDQVKGVWLEVGETLSTDEEISISTKLSYKKTRMAIDYLIERGTLGRTMGETRAGKRAGKKTVYTLLNWGIYQGSHKPKGETFDDKRARQKARCGRDVGESSINILEEGKKGNDAYAQGTQSIGDAIKATLELPEGFDSWPMAQQVAYWGRK